MEVFAKGKDAERIDGVNANVSPFVVLVGSNLADDQSVPQN